MIDSAYLRILGLLAILGGGVRIVTSFVPWVDGSLALEAVALGIDLCLLFGLTGFYVAFSARLGAAGFVGYLVAASGIALIAGPDGEAFGIDIYQAGVAVIAAGLAVLSLILLIRRIAPPAALLWFGAIAAAVGGGALGYPGQAFAVAGAAFGAGFVAAGFSTMRQAGKS